MAVENWIDEVAALAGSIKGEGNKRVRAFYMFKKDEFPGAIMEFPAAISYVTDVSIQDMGGGAQILHWQGKTEFHLTPDAGRQHMPLVMGYFKKILAAFAANKLKGKVELFMLLPIEQGQAINGPALLSYGTSELQRWGLIANWYVKERI